MKSQNIKTPLAIKMIASWIILAGILNILLEEVYILPRMGLSYIILLITEPLSLFIGIPNMLLYSIESDSYFVLFTLPAIFTLILLALVAFLLIKKYKTIRLIFIIGIYLSILLTLLSPWSCMLNCSDTQYAWVTTWLVPRLILNILIASLLTYYLFINKNVKEYFKNK
ncbi:MAG: hypothetical protein Q8L29_03290 [archaeon]|nr:hypothetical protein [archaeon]